MNAIITFIVILLAVIFIFHNLAKRGIKLDKIFDIFSKDLRSSFRREFSGGILKNLYRIKIVVLYLSLFLFLVMLITGFIPTLFNSHHLTGLPLILHVTAAPLFAVLLAVLIFLYSHELKLLQKDYINLTEKISAVILNGETGIKIIFWLITFFSIPLLLSIILILYPILGTEFQELNIIIHRYSATIISLLVIFLMYAYIVDKAQK